jgi:hypothetical protein
MCHCGHYVPKVSYPLIQAIYRIAQTHKVRMTTIIDILILEGLNHADIALALAERKDRKKKAREAAIAQARLSDEGFETFALWKSLYPGLRAPLPGPSLEQYPHYYQ